MREKLALAYETRRPLLTHVADALRVEILEALNDSGLELLLNFRSLDTREFLERADKIVAPDANPLVDVPDQIVGQVEFDTLAVLNQAAAVLKEFLTELSRSWTEFSSERLPELHLSCLIPPQAKPEGWSDRQDVPKTFELRLCVSPKKQATPLPRLHPAPAHFALVMKGGGIKGLAYVGAIEILASHYKFNWYIGTSAGAITAVLLGAGYTPAELLDTLQKKDFRDFFDAPWYKRPMNLLFHKGLHSGDAFTNWLDTLLATKRESHTRVQLSELTPNRVTVYASRRGKRVLKFDSVDGNADAAYAARCSMSIPFIFMPQTDQGIRTYDGGLQHNFPVDELLRDHQDTPFISLFLGNEVYEPAPQRFILTDLISIWTESNDADLIAQYRDQTIVIDPRPIGTLDFNLTPTEKEFLVAAGRAAALAYIDKTSDACAIATQIRNELKADVETARSKRKRNRILKTAFVVLLGSALLFLIWRTVNNPHRTRLLHSSTNYSDLIDAKHADISMPGIVVHRRTVLIDLTNEQPVDLELLDTSKASPSVHTYSIDAERLSDDAHYIAFEFASQRKQMDIAALTKHPYQVWYRQDPRPLGEGFDNVWTIVMDVTQHSRNIPFTAKFRVTRFNAYQAENKNFVGHLVAGNEEEISTHVTLPRGFSLSSKPLLKQKKQGDVKTDWQPFSGDPDVKIHDDRKGFAWELRKPPPGWAYAAEIDWRKE